jgi:hypothetical protein
MPATIGHIYAPNRIVVQDTEASTDILVIAMDGTGYADLTSLIAAGKTPFPFGTVAEPGLDAGMFLQSLSVENVTDPTNSWRIAWNTGPAAPDGDSMTLIPGGTAQITIPGPVNNVWLQKSDTGDTLTMTGLY